MNNSHVQKSPKRGRSSLNKFIHIILITKFVAVEIAATVIFFVWLYRELIHEIKR